MTSRKWTYEDLLRLPYDGMRHEIIDGVHYVTEPHYTKEQRVVARLKALLHYPLRETFFYRREWTLTTMGVPGFVIHVLPDRKMKFQPTLDETVAEHWIIHPTLNSVGIFRRNGGRFERVLLGDTLTTPLLPWFALSVRELFSD